MRAAPHSVSQEISLHVYSSLQHVIKPQDLN